MHRLLCLLILGALVACDDAPAPPAATESSGCGMTLPGVGTWTVGQYDDGYLIDANREVALRTAADDQLWWHRLDGTGSGPVDLGTPIADDQSIDLYDANHLLIRGLTDDFQPRARLIRLSDNRIVHEMEYRFEGHGEWVITGNTQRRDAPQPRLRSLSTGASFELPCQPCDFEAADGFGRVWVSDAVIGALIEVELSTGRITRHPDLFSYSSQMQGAGLAATRDGDRARLLFGAASTPVMCEGRNARVASTGLIACPTDVNLNILDPAGQVTRTVTIVEPWSVHEFGAGFLVKGREGTAWVPFAESEPVVRTQGSTLVRTGQVTMLRDFESEQTTILHADGRVVTLDYTVTSPPEVTADGTLALIRRPEDFAVIDLDTGAVTLEVPLDSGWRRFVGSVLLLAGAPLGETGPSNLSNVLFPDSRCPVMLFEQCELGGCALNIQQFETEGGG